MAAGGDRAYQIDELHQTPAKKIADGIGVIGEDDFAPLGLRLGHGPAVHGLAHLSIL